MPLAVRTVSICSWKLWVVQTLSKWLGAVSRLWCRCMSPAALSRAMSSPRMRPSEAQGSTVVSALMSRMASSMTESSSSFEMRVPLQTMENSRAPAASAAFACSRISAGGEERVRRGVGVLVVGRLGAEAAVLRAGPRLGVGDAAEAHLVAVDGVADGAGTVEEGLELGAGGEPDEAAGLVGGDGLDSGGERGAGLAHGAGGYPAGRPRQPGAVNGFTTILARCVPGPAPDGRPALPRHHAARPHHRRRPAPLGTCHRRETPGPPGLRGGCPHRAAGQTLAIWIDDPSLEAICHETSDEVIHTHSRRPRPVRRNHLFRQRGAAW